MLPEIARKPNAGLQSGGSRTQIEPDSGSSEVTRSVPARYSHSSSLDQSSERHTIRHHKSHGTLREATHKAWTNPFEGRDGVTGWSNPAIHETGTRGGPGLRSANSTSWSSFSYTGGNMTFPSVALEAKHNQPTAWGQQATENFTEGYSNFSSGSASALYPNNIPSVSGYASHYVPFPQTGAASYLTAGEQAQHVPTSSLYNIMDVSNSSNSSFVYNISLDGIVNDTAGPPWLRPPVEVTFLEIVIAVILSGFILAIIVGNMFVILSVALFRDMRTLTNGLIVSLASADLLVAIIVLPISLYHEIIGSWTLGPYICDFWITSDVFCCTASILNIVVIAIDRYWLITKNVRYTHNRTFPRQRAVVIMCFLAWILSGIISSSPLFGWQDGSEDLDPYACIISQDLGYTIFSTFGAFWFPLMVILLVYMKIFKIARKRAKTRARAQAIHPSMNSTVLSEANGKPSRYSRPSKSDSNSPQTSPKLPKRRVSSSHSKRSHRGRIRSSARTLGLIIGGFVFCWLPFFILATILPFCAACQVPPYVMSIVLWLGYSNSLLNPAIYAIWDKNFRRSFKRLATCSVRWTHVLWPLSSATCKLPDWSTNILWSATFLCSTAVEKCLNPVARISLSIECSV